jgi:hypothetical protein
MCVIFADAEHDDDGGTIVVRQQRQQIQEVSLDMPVPLAAKPAVSSYDLHIEHMNSMLNCSGRGAAACTLQLQAALAQKDQHITSLQEALAAKGDEVSSNSGNHTDTIYNSINMLRCTSNDYRASCGCWSAHSAELC